MTGPGGIATPAKKHLVLAALLLFSAETILLAEGAPPVQTPGVTPAGQDFRLTVEPASVSVRRGSSAPATVKVEAVGAFKGTVHLQASLLLDTEMTFAPPALEGGGGTSTLTIAPRRSAIKGSYVIAITAIDGGISHSVTVSVKVR